MPVPTPARRSRIELRSLTLLTSLATTLAACARPNMAVLQPAAAAEPRAVDICAGTCRDSLRLTYLGVSGFVLRHGQTAIMTAPSFTHPGMVRVILPSPFRLSPDTALIDTGLGAVDMRGIAAILVGHAHYDHLIDVPYVARTKAPDARIYGSATMANTLAGDPRLRGRTVAVGDSAATATRAGRWIYPAGGSFRFMPLASSHAPNLWRYTFADGRVQEARTSLPRTARGWRKGEVYAYLIDLIAPDSTPRLRLYYQDAAADSAYVSLPPLEGRDARPVDVAILSVGNYEGARGNPDALLGGLRPRYVVLSHWEDFFRSPLDPLQVIPMTDTEWLVSRVRERVGDAWITPEPLAGLTVHF